MFFVTFPIVSEVPGQQTDVRDVMGFFVSDKSFINQIKMRFGNTYRGIGSYLIYLKNNFFKKYILNLFHRVFSFINVNYNVNFGCIYFCNRSVTEASQLVICYIQTVIRILLIVLIMPVSFLLIIA